MRYKTKLFILTLSCLLFSFSLVKAESQMPSGFNGDLVLPPKAELIDSKVDPPYVEVVSSNPMKAMYEFYKKDLTTKGWEVIGDYPNLGNTYQIQFNKEGKTLSIGIGAMSDGKAIARILLM